MRVPSGQLSGTGMTGGRLLPVLVVVHGGDYVRGAASLLGPQRLMREDVVLVTINYRLGALGEFPAGSQRLMREDVFLREVKYFIKRPNPVMHFPLNTTQTPIEYL